MTYWKSLKYKDGKIISNYDKSEWKIGEWRTVCEPTELCKGLNCSDMILDAIGFVKPDVIAEVEIFGKCLKDTDKYTCERMRILRAWITPPKLYVEMAIFAAQQVLKYYEAKYPDDKRPREAIEKAQACVDAIGTDIIVNAATYSAYHAAYAAYAAADAADAATYAAYAANAAADAAYAAYAAADAADAATYAAYAAYAANAAAYAANAAAYAANAAADAVSKTDKEKARSEMRQKIEQWLIDHITALPEMQT